MSGIAGVYNWDGRPADAGLLRRMTDAMAHRGPDGVEHWVHGPVGLSQRMLHTTPESLLEQQPLTDESGTLCLTLDGRVDNRAELKAALEAKGARLRDSTDAELVLRAYECWEEECPAKILGDFAFAIWDARKRQFFCARDAVGARPFYYHRNDRTFLFASELHALLEDPDFRREPNQGVVGEYLANAFTSKEETLLKGIFRLPQAHCLIIEASGKIRKTQYWDVDPAKEIRYRTDEEYAEAFREIFQEAVRCRLRSQRPVGSHLSGGLDSSSIACMAAWLARNGLVSPPGFETFSLVFPGHPSDESPYIREVVEKWGLPSNPVVSEIPDPQRYREQAMRFHDLPYVPSGQMFDPLMTRVQQKGMRVLLAGQWGDQWLTGSLLHNADLLRRLRLGKLLRQVRWDSHFLSQVGGDESASYLLLRYGLWPLLPKVPRTAVKWALRRPTNGVPSWIGRDLARREELSARLQDDGASEQRWPSRVQSEIHAYLSSGRSSCYREWEEVYASRLGLEARYPFLDRRLIEYTFGLPEEQRWRRDQPRFMMRKAMRGLLPESVRWRLTKADFSHLPTVTIQMLGGEDFLDSLEISRLGWVEAEEIRRMYRHMVTNYEKNHPDFATYHRPLWFVVAMELWFRYTFGSLSATKEGWAPRASLQPV